MNVSCYNTYTAKDNIALGLNNLTRVGSDHIPTIRASSVQRAVPYAPSGTGWKSCCLIESEEAIKCKPTCMKLAWPWERLLNLGLKVRSNRRGFEIVPAQGA